MADTRVIEVALGLMQADDNAVEAAPFDERQRSVEPLAHQAACIPHAGFGFDEPDAAIGRQLAAQFGIYLGQAHAVVGVGGLDEVASGEWRVAREIVSEAVFVVGDLEDE